MTGLRRTFRKGLALGLALYVPSGCARSSAPAPDAVSHDASVPAPVASTEPVRVPDASVPPRDADRTLDFAARTDSVRKVFGPHAQTRIVGGLFLVGAPHAARALFDQAVTLLERALPPLFEGRFTRRPDAPVTILLFDSDAAYNAFAKAHYGRRSEGDFGAYEREPREIAMNGSGGANYVPTLTHEIIHPIVQTDFPGAPLWFDEAIASLFEAPTFPKDGGIGGEPRNWRHKRLLQALASKDERDSVRLDSLFHMRDLAFRAWHPDSGVDDRVSLLNCAMARAFAAWLDGQGKLWPFYRAWRDGFAADPTGVKTFERVMGESVEEANAAWLAWVR